MKTIGILMCGLWAMVFALRVLFAETPETLPTSAPSPTTVPSSGDTGTELVVAFYKVLLQDSPRTLEQEKYLFNPTPGLRERLVAGGQGKAKDPVILEFLCKRKDLFLPKKMRGLDDVSVSSTFQWVRDIVRIKEAPKKGDGYVVAMFYEDPTADPEKMKCRTIVFAIADGKIEADEIYLDGYGNKSSLEEFLKVKVEKGSD